MSSLPETANAYADWRLVAGVLGLPCTGDALPAHTTCPFCGGVGRLNIYEDSTTGGQWHYCLKCRHAGDMIDLAAAVWGISQDQAIRRLADGGIAIPAEFYTEQAEYNFTRVKRRRQAADLWRQSREQLEKISIASAVVRKLRERLKLYTRGGTDRWKLGPGQMFGAATLRQIQEALLAPGSLPARYANNASFIFRRSGWRDAALLFPHFSAPENLDGFLFVGREARPEDRIYRSVTIREEDVSGYEGGLFGFETTMQPPTVIGRHIVAMDDAVTALRLQVRHSTQSSQVLPLVSYYDHRKVRTHVGWHALNRPVTVWAWKITASVVYAAMQTDGHIALMAPEEDTPHNRSRYLLESAPIDLLRRAIKRGVPWQDALVAWATDRPVIAVEALLAELHAKGVNSAALASLLDIDVGEVQQTRTVTFSSWNYTERRGGWYCKYNYRIGREAPFTDYIVRLDYVTTTGDMPWYVGRVLWQGRTVHFASSASNLMRQVQVACLQAGLGAIRLDHPSKVVERVALAFQRPQLTSEHATVALCRSLGVQPPKAANAKYEAQKLKQPKAPKLSVEVVPVDFDRIDVAEQTGRDLELGGSSDVGP